MTNCHFLAPALLSNNYCPDSSCIACFPPTHCPSPCGMDRSRSHLPTPSALAPHLRPFGTQIRKGFLFSRVSFSTSCGSSWDKSRLRSQGSPQGG
ncbi:hypothetical protein NPIL_499271 [Nephila pilipes]|uniref:Uncharacterized protein n=1 Tax=Nephila pilipes TaxID=299642 RepID=A0A8X6TV62_NEPPI|nr:hypothetical protein NPIL_499271 [Nephila pilipes]